MITTETLKPFEGKSVRFKKDMTLPGGEYIGTSAKLAVLGEHQGLLILGARTKTMDDKLRRLLGDSHIVVVDPLDETSEFYHPVEIVKEEE